MATNATNGCMGTISIDYPTPTSWLDFYYSFPKLIPGNTSMPSQVPTIPFELNSKGNEHADCCH
jgi:hypothetical protein